MKKQSETIPSVLQAAITDGTPQAIVERYASLAAAAASTDYGEWDSDLVVLDTETTGLSFNHDELIQIAAARVENGRIADWFVTFVNPGKVIPDDIVRLTGITNQHVADAPMPAEALTDLVAFVGSSTIVAHNAAFDKTFLTAHVEGYPLLENRWIDSLDLSRIALPRMRAHRLTDLGKAFGAPENTHRADDDVAATCYALRILFAAVDAMPTPLLYAIGNLASPDDWPTGIVFASFAQRHMQEAGETNRPAFSVSGLRRARLPKEPPEPKADAFELLPDTMNPPTYEDVDDAFSANGLVGSLYGNYEPRPEQRTMARAIADAFAENHNLVVEAGTGVGKSMAYLLPSAILATRNGITVGVATKTNALLDQLVFHELPALDEALASEGGITYAALKGFSHYLCLRKVAALASAGGRMRDVGNQQVSTAPSIAAALSFIEQTDWDDCDSLKLDYRALPRVAITTPSHECLRRKCRFYNECFVHGARKRAENVDILVTNHTMLFCDLTLDGGLLPPVRHWIIDEAHGTEDEARDAFSVQVDSDELLRIVQHVTSKEASRNVLTRAERLVLSLNPDETQTLLEALLAKARQASDRLAGAVVPFVQHVKDLLYYDTESAKGYESVDLWLNDDIRRNETFAGVAEYNAMAMDAAEKTVTALQELVAVLEGVEGAGPVEREIAGVAIQLKEIIKASAIIFGETDPKYVYSATLYKKKDRQQDTLVAAPLYVGPELARTLFAQTRSVVFASATLTVDGRFEAFERALGLNSSDHDSVTARTLQLDSSFDFDENMRIFVASDMPEPNRPGYLDALKQLIADAHIAQEGSMLTLFTNRREMEECYDAVLPILHDHGLHAVCQKWGVSTKTLRDDFLKDEHLSLFALKSFWEGFDAPGTTLRGVIIPKLPFTKPTDPLSRERAARDQSAWAHYDLPAAVIDVKQAVGRLIRTRNDRGVIIFADSRLVSKSYRNAFLKSLPSSNVTQCSCAQIVERLADMRED